MSAAREWMRDDRKAAVLWEDWRERGETVTVRANSGSMRPTIPVGSQLRIRCGEPDAQPGQILAFFLRGAVTVHRLRSIEGGPRRAEQRLVCQGDANAAPDPPVKWSDVLGVVLEVRPPSWAYRARMAWWNFSKQLRR